MQRTITFCRIYSEEGALFSIAKKSTTNLEENSNIGSTKISIYTESIESEGSITHVQKPINYRQEYERKGRFRETEPCYRLVVNDEIRIVIQKG